MNTDDIRQVWPSLEKKENDIIRNELARVRATGWKARSERRRNTMD